MWPCWAGRRSHLWCRSVMRDWDGGGGAVSIRTGASAVLSSGFFRPCDYVRSPRSLARATAIFFNPGT